jgi:predicted XRE-type DNA-binding protein
VSDQHDYTVGSGNVFADLGVAEPEEALAKAQLVRQIGAIVARRGWTQAQAAAVLGIDQPKVSALLRGRLGGFSTDRLCRFLNALDHDVQIVVTPKPPTRRRATTTVAAAAEPIPASGARSPESVPRPDKVGPRRSLRRADG